MKKVIYVTSSQMANVDRIAVKKYGINILQLMENAGRNLADFVSGLKPKKVVVFFGKGNNGGGGLVAARHLTIRKINTEIVSASSEINETPMKQLYTLRKMGIKEKGDFKLKKGDVIIDALLGYNIKGDPKERYADMINSMNFMKKKGIKVVSLDLPSGLNPDSGKPYNPCVRADYTITLALPKVGLRLASKKIIGKVFLANIGIPDKAYSDLNISIKNYFSKNNIIPIKCQEPLD